MEQILKYQELDGKLQQLERKVSASSEKAVMNQMIQYVKELSIGLNMYAETLEK